MKFEAFLVKIVHPKGKMDAAKDLLRAANEIWPKDFEIDVEYEGIQAKEDFYGERYFDTDPMIVNQIKT
jgi:hypothetical protein